MSIVKMLAPYGSLKYLMLSTKVGAKPTVKVAK